MIDPSTLMFGAIPSGDDPRDYSIAAAGQYPSSFMPKRLPVIRSQGSIGSCVAHACAYVNEYYDNKAFATDFVYGYRPDGYYSGIGMKTREACGTLLHAGNVLQADFTGNTEVSAVTEKVQGQILTLLPLAAKNRIESYARLYTADDAKTALHNGMPVIVVTRTYNDFGADKNGTLKNNIEAGSRASHAMTFFGWDDSKGFYTANSWGKAWGKDGFCWMPYMMMEDGRYVTEMWAIADTFHKDLILRTLRYGMRGNDVAQLQSKLNGMGYPCGVTDGIFGQKTHDAVRAAQKAYRLAVDGICGAKTRAVMNI